MKWRVGRSLGRTLYIQSDHDASKLDQFVGIMDSRALADEVVSAINTLADLRAKVEALQHADSCAADMSAKLGRCTCMRADVLALIDGGAE